MSQIVPFRRETTKTLCVPACLAAERQLGDHCGAFKFEGFTSTFVLNEELWGPCDCWRDAPTPGWKPGA